MGGDSDTAKIRHLIEVDPSRSDCLPTADVFRDTLDEDLLASLYTAIGDADPWQSFLTAMRITTGSFAATLILQPAKLNHPDLIFTSTDEEAAPHRMTYRDLFWHDDPFVDLPADVPLTLDDFVGGTACLRETQFYRDHLGPANAPYVMGVDFAASDGVSCRFRLSRREAAGMFSAQEKMFCARILPHMKRAAALFCRLATAESERDGYMAVLDRLHVGVIVVDPAGIILSSNAAASLLLGERDGLEIMDRRLFISPSATARTVRAAIHRACGSPTADSCVIPRVVRIDRPSGRMSLGLVVKSMPAPSRLPLPVRRTALLLISDPARLGDGDVDVLTELWGLTPAEGVLSIKMMQGISVDEASLALGISRNTARAHLRSIFAKTDVHRQSALASLLLHSAVQLA